MKYQQMLRMVGWQKKRVEALVRDGFACVNCKAGDLFDMLHVHHKWYPPIGEPPWAIPLEALQTLCDVCHENVHGKAPLRLVNWTETAEYHRCLDWLMHDGADGSEAEARENYREAAQMLPDYGELRCPPRVFDINGCELFVFKFDANGTVFVVSTARREIWEAGLIELEDNMIDKANT